MWSTLRQSDSQEWRQGGSRFRVKFEAEDSTGFRVAQQPVIIIRLGILCGV